MVPGRHGSHEAMSDFAPSQAMRCLLYKIVKFYFPLNTIFNLSPPIFSSQTRPTLFVHTFNPHLRVLEPGQEPGERPPASNCSALVQGSGCLRQPFRSTRCPAHRSGKRRCPGRPPRDTGCSAPGVPVPPYMH